MIAPVVVVADEGGDGCIEVRRQLIGDLVDVPLDGLVIALQLAVGLRVVRRGQDVPDAYQPEVVSKGSGHVARAVVAQQLGSVCHRDLSHAGPVHRILDHLDERVGGHVPLELMGNNEA